MITILAIKILKYQYKTTERTSLSNFGSLNLLFYIVYKQYCIASHEGGRSRMIFKISLIPHPPVSMKLFTDSPRPP